MTASSARKKYLRQPVEGGAQGMQTQSPFQELRESDYPKPESWRKSMQNKSLTLAGKGFPDSDKIQEQTFNFYTELFAAKSDVHRPFNICTKAYPKCLYYKLMSLSRSHPGQSWVLPLKVSTQGRCWVLKYYPSNSVRPSGPSSVLTFCVSSKKPREWNPTSQLTTNCLPTAAQEEGS